MNTRVPGQEVDNLNWFFGICAVLIGFALVGGYITYAGAHRLLDAGVSGPDKVTEVSRSSVISLVVTGVLRVVLFLAVLGVVAGGASLEAEMTLYTVESR